VYGVTSLLATQRIQDAFALANYRFAPEENTVVRISANGHPAARGERSEQKAGQTVMPHGRPANTRFLFLREGRVYFEGNQDEVTLTGDAYLQRFLV
jgi:hypothetical protein